jgi:hypothetical protein
LAEDALDNVVAPVNWLNCDDESESENADPETVVDVCCAFSAPVTGSPATELSPALLENANEDAVLAMSYPPVPDPELTNWDDGFPEPLAAGVAAVVVVVAAAPTPIANSISVGCFGIGGGSSEVEGPNGFFDPV